MSVCNITFNFAGIRKLISIPSSSEKHYIQKLALIGLTKFQWNFSVKCYKGCYKRIVVL